jgi:two-component system chemotaxis response regulator CheB
MASGAGRPLRVLVVDDSALVREVVQRIFAGDDSFAITTASDPLIAARKIAAARPDVILLDLAMPQMDGLSFLRKVMAEDPIPVVVCSSMTGDAPEMAMRALGDGALDVVTKPRVGVRGFLEESFTLLVDTLRAAAQASVTRRTLPREAVGPFLGSRARPAGASAARHARPFERALVAIGASTGGTEALAVLLGGLPEDAPGVVVVQHMPEGFTGPFARRLDGGCRIAVKEAADGDSIEPGCALIAPGGRHMTVSREGSRWRARVADGVLVSRHRPSVDVLFHSVARAAGPSALGVILTGMGRDGADGLRAMKQRGAWTIAQDEATSVVFGMPREAIASGVVDDVVPLSRIAQAILDRCALQGARSANRSEG